MNRYVAILDRVFSEYIRRKNANHQGVVKCFTCGKFDDWKEMDAGHYISRAVMATRFDERNVQPQCRFENRFREGVKDEFALALQKKYGLKILEELNQLKWSNRGFSELELKEMVKHHRKLIKEL